MKNFKIKNKTDNQSFDKQFETIADAKEWVINHLDLSKKWTVTLIKPKFNKDAFFVGLLDYGFKHQYIEKTNDGIKFVGNKNQGGENADNK